MNPSPHPEALSSASPQQGGIILLNKQPDFLSGAATLPVPQSMFRFDGLNLA